MKTLLQKKGKVNFGKKRSSKVSSVKHANKHYSKLQKRGKLRKKKKKNEDENSQKNDVQNNHSVEEDINPMDMMEEEDIKFIRKNAKIKNITNNMNKNKRKRPESEDDCIEADYERAPRKAVGKNKRLKSLLPIKNQKGIIPQFLEINDKEEEIEVSEEENENKNHINPKEPPKAVDLFVSRSRKLDARKEKIALLATKILENPEENMRSLKELRLMLDDKDKDIYITLRKLVCLSLLEIFKDILPSYRIRPRTDKEQKQKLKKENKKIFDFEEALLRHYKLYLRSLQIMTQGLKKKKNPSSGSEAFFGLGQIALRCLCELLISHPYFNCRGNIINIIMPFTDHFDEKVSTLVCDAVTTVYKADKVYEVSLELVKATNRVIKQKNFEVQSKVLKTFLALKLRDADLKQDIEEKKKFMTKKEKMAKLSRNQRKKSKMEERVEKDLEETAAVENKQKKSKIQIEIVSQVFLTYFKILKSKSTSTLFPVVLEGIAKFAHLINIEFFDDLVANLHLLIDSGNLGSRECLHCIQTVFTILSGQGSSLTVDPQRFYTHLYRLLFTLHAGSSTEDLSILFTCLDLMFTKRRKQVTHQRVLAFIKRLCLLSMCLLHNGVLATLSFVRGLLQTHKYADIILDTDTYQGSGVYLPELDEPEHCNANATALWELHTIKKFYHPAVRKVVDSILSRSSLQGEQQELMKKSPSEICTLYSPENMEFKPAFSKPTLKHNVRSKKRNDGEFVAIILNDQVEKCLSSVETNVNFYKSIFK